MPPLRRPRAVPERPRAHTLPTETSDTETSDTAEAVGHSRRPAQQAPHSTLPASHVREDAMTDNPTTSALIGPKLAEMQAARATVAAVAQITPIETSRFLS